MQFILSRNLTLLQSYFLFKGPIEVHIQISTTIPKLPLSCLSLFPINLFHLLVICLQFFSFFFFKFSDIHQPVFCCCHHCLGFFFDTNILRHLQHLIDKMFFTFTCLIKFKLNIYFSKNTTQVIFCPQCNTLGGTSQQIVHLLVRLNLVILL